MMAVSKVHVATAATMPVDWIGDAHAIALEAETAPFQPRRHPGWRLDPRRNPIAVIPDAPTELRLESGDQADTSSLDPAFSRHIPASELFEDYEAFQVAGWDCEGAEPISPETLRIASALIDRLLSREVAPAAAPGADGSIGLEWWRGDARLFIDIGPDREIRTYLNLGYGKPEEDALAWGDARLPAHLERLFAELYQRSATTATAA